MALKASAIRFNGVNQRIQFGQVPSIAGVEDLTWMAWFKVGPNSTRPAQRAWVERSPTNGLIRFAFTPLVDKVRFELAIADNHVDTNYDYKRNLNDNRWHHAAFTAQITNDNPSYSIYLDGVEVSRGDLHNPAGRNEMGTGLTQFVYAGGYRLKNSEESDDFLRAWEGGLSEVICLRSGLAGNAIQDYITSRTSWPIPDDDLVYYYKLEEGFGEGLGPNQVTQLPEGSSAHTLLVGYAHPTTANTNQLWTLDRPWLGDGLADTDVPSVPNWPTNPITNVTTDGFTVWGRGSAAFTDNIFPRRAQFQVSRFSDFNDFESYDVQLYPNPYNFILGGSAENTNIVPGAGSNYRIQSSGNGTVVRDTTVSWHGVGSYRGRINTGSGQTDVAMDFVSGNLWTKTDRRFSARFAIRGNQNYTFPANSIYLRVVYTDNTVTRLNAPATAITTDWKVVTLVGLKPNKNRIIKSVELHIGTPILLSSLDFWVDGVVIQDGNADPGPIALTDPMLEVDDLFPNTNYYVRYRLIDEAGNTSGYSTTQSVTTASTGDIVAPEAPAYLSPVSVNHMGFIVSWPASVSSDVAGYRLDIAYDADFKSYVASHRNINVGNTLMYNFTDGYPLLAYYIRVRAYDTAGNESVSTEPLYIRTTPQPDVTPPNIVELAEASSVTSKEFVANWYPGIDDVGVVGYYVDVATDEEFTQIVTGYNNKNVGNTLSTSVVGLAPSTLYYYRVRAYDSAGNVSANTETPSFVVTSTPTVTDGDLITSLVDAVADTYVDATNTTINYDGEEVLLVSAAADAATQVAYLQIDLSDTVGAIQSALLNIFVESEENLGDPTYKLRVSPIEFDSQELTWATRPTMTGDTIEFDVLGEGEWVTIDITPLLTAGNAVYTAEILTEADDNALVISSQETSDSAPYVELETDPSVSTEVLTLEVTPLEGQLVNYIKNPSMETNTGFWTSVGLTTISRSTVTSKIGNASMQLVTTGVANQGAYHNSPPVATQGDVWSAAAYVRTLSGTTTIQLALQELNSAQTTVLAEATKNVVVGTEWRRIELTKEITDPLASYLRLRIHNVPATTLTYFVDGVVLVESPYVPAYFDGTTSGGWWSGTADASTSLINSAAFELESTYIGDMNENNNARVFFNRLDQEAINIPAVDARIINDRPNNRVTAQVGPSFGPYNYMRNPSFEIDLAGWTNTTGAVLSRSTGNAYVGNASLAVEVVDNALSLRGARSPRADANVGEVWNAQARVYQEVTNAVSIRIVAYDASGAIISGSSIVDGVSRLLGTENWQLLTTTYTLPANTYTVNVEVTSDTLGTFYVDAVQLSKGSYINPYLDGGMSEGVWEGAAHDSYSSLLLIPETIYEVGIEYDDPDGIVDGEDGTYLITQEYTTAPIQDNVLTTSSIQGIPWTTSIDVIVGYIGDDNENAVAVIEWRRTDLSAWSAVPVSWDRNARQVRATIPDLYPGTSYTIRTTFQDTDGVYGNNPLTTVVQTVMTEGAPDITPTISFGGFVLMGRDDAKIGVVHHDGAFGLPERRLQIESLPRVDGAVELENLWGRRTISVSGFVQGETRAELEDNKNALKVALSRRQQRLVLDTLSSYGRFFYATCESLAISEVAGENLRHLMWDAEFVCADPFAYSLVETQINDATIGSGDTIVFENEGDITINSHLTITTASVGDMSIVVRNLTTGQTIRPVGSISSSDTMVIDNQRLSVKINEAETDYGGGFFELTPGANIIEFELNSAWANPTIYMSARWRHRYL